MRRHKDPRCQNCTPRGNPPLTDPGFSRPAEGFTSRDRLRQDIICIASKHYRSSIMSVACTLDSPTVPFPSRAGARGVAVAYAGGRGHAIAWIACWRQAPVRRYAVRFRAVPNWIAQQGRATDPDSVCRGFDSHSKPHDLSRHDLKQHPGRKPQRPLSPSTAIAFGRGVEGNGPHAGPRPAATASHVPPRCCLPGTAMAALPAHRRLRARTVRRWPPSSAACTWCAGGRATT